MEKYNEELIITEIEKYLLDCKYKGDNFKKISYQLYDKFIDNDDNHVIKLIKKIMIIYKRFHSKLIQKILHKWQINTLKLNYGIFDYKNNIFNLENELDEPQLEYKPNLYYNNLYKNYNKKKKKNNLKNYQILKYKSKNKSKTTKSEIKNKDRNNKKKIYNIKKITQISSSIDIKNKRILKIKNKKNKNISNTKSKKLNKTEITSKENEEDNENDFFFNNRTFEQKCKNKNFQKSYSKEKEQDNDNNKKKKLENLKTSNKYKDIEKEKNLYNFNNNINNSNNNKNNIFNPYDFNLNFDTNKSRSVDRKQNINNIITLNPKPWAYSYYIKNNKSNDTFIKIRKNRPLMNKIQRQELFNKLYNDSKKRKEKYKILSMEKEAKFNMEYTFTPQIIYNKLNEKYLKNMADSKFSVKSGYSNTSSFYNNNLNNKSMITSSNNNYSILNNARFDTSKNIINELPIVMEENKNEFPLDFMKRLEEYEKIKKINLEKIKKEVDISIRGNSMNKNKIPYNKLSYSLINNFENYFENKQKNLEKIARNMYEEQGITFHPKTNKSYNDKITNNIIERNQEFIKDKQEKLVKYLNLKEDECTFMPKINNIANISILNNSKGGYQSTLGDQNTTDVSKRLFDYQNKYKEKLEDIRSKYKENYSFKPEISKNTDIILNNKKKKMEQNKENENNLINNIKENYKNKNNNGTNNDKDNENDKSNDYINNYNIHNELLMNQMKLEEISKRISELSEENIPDEKYSPKNKNNNKKSVINDKRINKKNQIVYNSNSIESNSFQINSTLKTNNLNYTNKLSAINHISQQNSDKALELAKNLINEGILNRNPNIIFSNENLNYNSNNNSSNINNNDFSSLMLLMNDNSKNGFNDINLPIFKRNNFIQEYDFDNIKGGKRIMDLNYYEQLL